MMKPISVVLPLLLAAGCALMEPEPVEPDPAEVALMELQAALAAAPPSRLGVAAGPLGEPLRQMAEQIDISLQERGIKQLPIAISGFVDLDQPQLHRNFGDQLAEGFYHELQARGYNLIDHRALPFGDEAVAMTSPQLSDFYRHHRVSYVLGGTFVSHGEGLSVHARMLDTITQQVVATGRAQLGLEVLEGRLPGYDPLSVRDGMIIENGGVPAQ